MVSTKSGGPRPKFSGCLSAYHFLFTKGSPLSLFKLREKKTKQLQTMLEPLLLRLISPDSFHF